MVADGTFPGPDADARGGVRARGSGDGVLRARAGRHDHLRQPERAVGVPPARASPATVLGEPVDALTSTVADDPFDASDLAAAVGTRDRRRQPASIEVDGGGATVLFRALPLRPRGETARRADADAGRHRAAPARPPDPEQGRDDPRDPSPGQEQPADRGRVAAAAGAAGGGARGPRGARGVDAPGQLDRAGPRDAVGVDGRVGRLRRGRRPAARHALGRHRVRRRVSSAPDGHLRRDAGRDRDRAGAGADRTGAERDRARVPGRRRPARSRCWPSGRGAG